MKTKAQLSFAIFILFYCNSFSQYAGCNQSTLTVNQIFYPATSTVYTSSLVGMEVLYLCGPNTIVYDTLYPPCRQVLLQPNTMYVTNSQGCEIADFIYAKSTSTVLIKANGNPGTFRVIYELGATIIDQTGSAVTFTCSSLSFPTINCTVGFKANELLNIPIVIYPNPATDYFDLNIEDFEARANVTSFYIYNSLGQVMCEEKLTFNNGQKRINTSDLAKGIYLVTIKTIKNESINKKLVINN